MLQNVLEFQSDTAVPYRLTIVYKILNKKSASSSDCSTARNDGCWKLPSSYHN